MPVCGILAAIAFALDFILTGTKTVTSSSWLSFGALLALGALLLTLHLLGVGQLRNRPPQ